jgi:hypothetical protein
MNKIKQKWLNFLEKNITARHYIRQVFLPFLSINTTFLSFGYIKDNSLNRRSQCDFLGYKTKEEINVLGTQAPHFI